MIKLDVQDYCHRCPYFEAVMVPEYGNKRQGRAIVEMVATGDTVIRCTRAEKCAWVVGEAFRCRKVEPQEKGEECCE